MPKKEEVVNPIPRIENLTYEDAMILLNIQRLWLEVIQWMRSFFHSSLGNRPEQTAIANRLFLELPADLYDEFIKYFSEEESQQFLNIISQLISINWDIMNAYKANDRASIELGTARWYQTANELAAFLATINEYYDESYLRTLLYDYIGLKLNEIIALINGDYALEIQIYDEIKEKVVQIANYMAMGVIAMQSQHNLPHQNLTRSLSL